MSHRSSGAAVAASPAASRTIGRVRYAVLALIFAVTVVNYADRATMSIAGTGVAHDLGLTPVQLGVVFPRSRGPMRSARFRAAGCSTASAHGACMA